MAKMPPYVVREVTIVTCAPAPPQSNEQNPPQRIDAALPAS